MIKSASQSSLTNDIKYRNLGASNVPSNEYLIETVVVPAGGASTVTFSNLSQWVGVYRHLQLVSSVRNTANAGTGPLLARFNNDSAGNYTYHDLVRVGGSTGSSASTGNTTINLGWIPHGSTTGGVFSINVSDILEWSSTTKNKVTRSMTGNIGFDSRVGILSGMWLNTSAITQIQLVAEGGNSFAQGSRFSLYGVTA